MKTLIGIPCMDMMHTKFVKSLIYMQKGENVNVCFEQNSLIYDSRNLISITAITQFFDYLLWLDSDMEIPADALMILRNDLENYPNIDMITGLYVKRQGNITPVMWSRIEPPAVIDGKPTKRIDDYVDYPKNSIFPIAGCGFGCVLMRVSLLKQVWDKFGPAFTPYQWAGEDISFCYKVNQLGKDRIWCDSNVICGHIGEKVYSESDLDRGDVSE